MVFEKLRNSRKVKVDDYIVALDIGTEFVKALIAKHGADRLSEVPETEYAALLADAEVLG